MYLHLEVNDCYGFHTTREPSSTTGNSDRWWPVDRPSRCRCDYKYHQRVHNVRGDHIRPGRGHRERSSQMRSGNGLKNQSDYLNLTRKRSSFTS